MNKVIKNMSKIFQSIRLNEFQEYLTLIDTIDINIKNEFEQCLLHEAVVYHRSEIAIDLLKRNIDINNKDRNGQTVFHYAALHNEITIAKMIINKGGDINNVDDFGNNALWTAVFYARRKYELVELFVNSGGDATHKNKSGMSALDFAVQINDNELINILS